MRRAGRTVLALAAGLVLGGCAAGGAGTRAPVVSPTGIVYPPGTPPVQTRFSQTAVLYLRQGQVDRALAQALEGIESDPENPVHSFLAGSAHARLKQYAEADSMFSQAQGLYPAYELDIEPQREAAWAEAFNAGLEAYAAGDVQGTIRAWQQATLIYDLRPEAHRNLATLLSQEGRYAEAIDVYQRGLVGLEKRPATRVLLERDLEERNQAGASMEENLVQLLLFTNRFAEAEPLLRRQLERDPANVQVQSDLASALSGQGRPEEARKIYAALLSEASLQATELFKIGISLFRSSDFMEASEAFRRLTDLQPNSRDAWFNYANSLFAAEAWKSLATVGDRLVELDPLNEKAALIVARAYLEIGDEEAAVRGVKRMEAAPVHLAELQMRPSEARTSVQGRVIGNKAEPGAPVRLRFTFYGDAEALGTETLTVPAPPSGESAMFVVSFGMRATAYRYELVT
ncbi:MAG: tetratricopeptide repeat protein [Gemmatimonadetes bacterium]|nr:tetratricopeptide repeat protein [Gemmatimonadota bacterium]